MCARGVLEGIGGPSSALNQLGAALVGTWKLAGGAEGLIRYERAEGGFFLIQHVDLIVFNRAIKGMEIIGHSYRVGEEPSAEISSRFYSYSDGLTLDYVYEFDGEKFTIWFMRRGSNNRFLGTFSDDKRSYEGAWTWPGGGYQVTATRAS